MYIVKPPIYPFQDHFSATNDERPRFSMRDPGAPEAWADDYPASWMPNSSSVSRRNVRSWRWRRTPGRIHAGTRAAS